MDEWVFVTGPPRSGTALTAALLNLHPRCRLLIETDFPVDLMMCLQPHVDAEAGYCSVQWRGATNRTQTSGWLLGRILDPAHGAPPLLEVARALCRSVRDLWPPVRFFGDKSPNYCFHWRTLRELFPGCHIIRCDRDLEQVVASVQRQTWAPAIAAEELRERMLQYAVAVAECPEAVCLSLEALEAEPERQIARLLEALSLRLEDYPISEAVGLVAHGNVNRTPTVV